MPRTSSYQQYIFNFNTKSSNLSKQCQAHNHCPENVSSLAQHGGHLNLCKCFPDPPCTDVYETLFFNEDDQVEFNEQCYTQNPMNAIQSSGLHNFASFSVSARAPNNSNNNNTSFNWKTNKPRSSIEKYYAMVNGVNRNVITTMNIKENHQNDRFANIIGCQTPSSQQPLNSSQQPLNSSQQPLNSNQHSLNSSKQFSNSNLEYTNNNQKSLVSSEKYLNSSKQSLNSIQQIAIAPSKRKQWPNGTLSTHQSKTDVCGQKRTRNELLLEQLLLTPPLSHNILSSLETVDKQNECDMKRNLSHSQNITQGLPSTRTYGNLAEVEAAVVYPEIDFVKPCNQSMKLPLILPPEQSTGVSCQESQVELLKDISNEYSSDEELSEDTIIIFDQEYSFETSTSESLVLDRNQQDLPEDELNSKNLVSREIIQPADRLPTMSSISLSSTETSKSPPQNETKSKIIQFSVNVDSKSPDNLEKSSHSPFNLDKNFVNIAHINYDEDKKFNAKERDRLLNSWWNANKESFTVVYSNVNNDIHCKVEIVDQSFVPSMTMVTTCNSTSTEMNDTATLSGDINVSGTSSLHVGMSTQTAKSEDMVKLFAAEQIAVTKSSSVHETTALLHSIKTVEDINVSGLKTSVSRNVVSGRKYVSEPKTALDQTKLLESRMAPDLATVSREIMPISVAGFVNVSKPSTSPKSDSIPSSQVLPRQTNQSTSSVVAPFLVSTSFDGSIAASFENPTSKTITPSIHNSQTVPTSTSLRLTAVDRAKISSMPMIGSKLNNDPFIGAVDSAATRPTAIKKFTSLVKNKPKPIDKKMTRSSTRQNRQCATFNYTGLGNITPGKSKGMVFENILQMTSRSRCQAVQTDTFAVKPTSLARNTEDHNKTVPRRETMPRRKSKDVKAAKMKSSCLQATTYSCNLCSYKSNELRNFRCHAQQCEAKEGLLPVEVDSWRLRCRRCGYISSGQEDLTNHFIKHQFQKRFLCGYCEQEFDQKVNVVEHILKVHQQSIIFYDREVYGQFSS
ncbi:general transcriptional corepressor trfA [Biomphalaria pfeifferi]|uniref:General transcriptional corepressor trfA n=1 Tax=Biomphalaria pfeifferi TaxID=112525 RepID=A0AAD8BYN7_BIOPF|nr:general transcriptional corepressor trfA [Biomphalaria pfeifferi]